MTAQVNLHKATRLQLSYKDDQGGNIDLQANGATILARPRGWHLDEDSLLIDSQPVAGAILDFGLYFFHNAEELIRRGRGPYFYLAKLEHYREARLWNDIFKLAQQELNIPQGSIRAHVVIETFPAIFEVEEILYELRDHCCGGMAGRCEEPHCNLLKI